MHQNAKRTKRMKVFPKGQVIIPVDLRRQYNIDIGDQIEFITFQDGILLKPSKKKPVERSLTEDLYGVLHSYVENKKFAEKEAISQATDAGFTNGWAE